MSEEVRNVIEEVQIPVDEIEALIPEEAVITELKPSNYGPKVAAFVAVTAGIVAAGLFIRKKLRSKKNYISNQDELSDIIDVEEDECETTEE